MSCTSKVVLAIVLAIIIIGLIGYFVCKGKKEGFKYPDQVSYDNYPQGRQAGFSSPSCGAGACGGCARGCNGCSSGGSSSPGGGYGMLGGPVQINPLTAADVRYDRHYGVVTNDYGIGGAYDLLSPFENSPPEPCDQLPDVNTEVPFHDVDIADPHVFLWRPTARIELRGRQEETADPLRGDLPIKKSNCTGGLAWFNSQYNESDIKLDGAFSEFTHAKYHTLTGQSTYPMAIANEELIMDNNCC